MRSFLGPLRDLNAWPVQTAAAWHCFRHQKAREAFLASQAIEQHIPAKDISNLGNFFYETDGVQEVLQIDGAVVTTNPLDNDNNRGEHPLLAPMSLHVYSMWVSRVEQMPVSAENRQVVLPFGLAYKLAEGYA